ncbi:MAG: hypothetical protein JSR46_06830 [Verrucomicrobia bacterium]|nr:hypothetical protein [Verrucomicrobiota bacterium]
MTLSLKKTWIVIVLAAIVASFVLTIKKPSADKTQSKNVIIVDRLVNTLIC